MGGVVRQKNAQRDLVVNRKARHEYFLEDRFEAGIVLLGPEVKSLRAGQANLKEAHVRVEKGSAWLYGCHIAPYTEAHRDNGDPLRPRRLLLHRSEITKLRKGCSLGGHTIVPVRIYLKGSWVKIEVALAKGKKLHDKRRVLKERSARDEMRRRR